MIKEEYKQLFLCSQFGGIRTMNIHRYCKQCKEIEYQPNNIEILKKEKYVISNTKNIVENGKIRNGVFQQEDYI